MSRTVFYCVVAAGVAGVVAGQAIAQTSGSAEVRLSRGIQAFMSEDYLAARREFEAAIAFDPKSAAAHYFFGLTLLQSAPKATSQTARTDLLGRALQEFEQSRLLDPQMVLAALDDGIARTLLGRFEEAESAYQQYLRERPDDPLPYLFLAVVYYRQAKEDPTYLPKAKENLDRAEDALKRSERIDPTFEAHIKLHRALINLQEGNREAARTALQESVRLAPDARVGRDSQELLDRVDWGAATTRRPWELTLQFGLDYDTNVVLRGEHVLNSRGEQSKDDGRFGVASAFTFRLLDTEDVVFGVGATTFDTWHADIDEFDVQTYGANAYVAFSPPDARWFTLGLRYDYDYSLVGRDSFLARHRVTPQVDIEETDWTATTLFTQLEVAEYFNQSADSRLDRDGVAYAFGAIQSFELFEMFRRQVTANVSYRFEDTHTKGSEFESNNHIFGLGFSVPFPEDITFEYLNEWELDLYDNPSIFDRKSNRRRDCIHTMIFALTKRFNEQLSARFEVNIITDDSNIVDRRGQEFFTYDRAIYGFSIIYNF